MKKTLKMLSIMLVLALALSNAIIAVDVYAVTGTNIDFVFKSEAAGYAEGTLSLETDTPGVYRLYWADDDAELSGYYPITTMDLSEKINDSFEFGYHTAIPAGATRVIAKDSSDSVVSEYSIPENKRLSASGRLYKFSSYSDVHIDNNGFYKDAETHWAEALKFSVKTDADFIVSSGDMVTNAAGPDSEWDVYEKILSQSAFVNPVWECNGNHDLRNDPAGGIKSFVRASGTDNTIANFDANKPYYYMKEKTTGDIFIFMALESEFSPATCDEFSEEQMNWVEDLLNTYYGTGVNIYIVEHSPIEGFGAGDRMGNQYYKA
ncbi:MAG: hypothetical protein IJ725_04305, partial [Ruminococcus sp.]|nr:hypothetical protein [Ruminococcus sp.]